MSFGFRTKRQSRWLLGQVKGWAKNSGKFAQEGANLVLTDLKKTFAKRQHYRLLLRPQSYGSIRRCFFRAVRSMFDHIMEEVGRVDILVNNAVLRACK